MSRVSEQDKLLAYCSLEYTLSKERVIRDAVQDQVVLSSLRELHRPRVEVNIGKETKTTETLLKMSFCLCNLGSDGS